MPHSDALARLWPASAVRVRAGDLELRWIDDDLLVELSELAGRGIHDPGQMPFEHPWSRGSADEVARIVLVYQWGIRNRLSPTTFALELGVQRLGPGAVRQRLLGRFGGEAADEAFDRRHGRGSLLTARASASPVRR